DLAKKINLRYLIVFSVGNAAYALMSLGDYAGAEARCMEVLSIAREIHAQHSIAQSHDMLGLIQYYKGEYEQSLLQYDQALQIHRTLGSLHQEGSTLANIAMVLNAQHRYAEALDMAQHALESADKIQAQRLKAEALNAAAEAMLGQHKLE